MKKNMKVYVYFDREDATMKVFGTKESLINFIKDTNMLENLTHDNDYDIHFLKCITKLVVYGDDSSLEEGICDSEQFKYLIKQDVIG